MIFLTGGTGLVGAHILLKLTESGQKVKALKRKRSSLTVIKNIFSHYKKTNLLQSIEWIEGDLLDLFSLQEGIKGCNTVIHCAAIVSFNPKDFKKVMKINVEGTANIVNICLENNIEKLAYISSIATLNDEKNQVRTEDSFWKESKSNSQYAKSKYLSASKCLGISFIFNKLFSIAATCSFEDVPFPVIDILIFLGAYSKIGIFLYNPAAIATP